MKELGICSLENRKLKENVLAALERLLYRKGI